MALIILVGQLWLAMTTMMAFLLGAGLWRNANLLCRRPHSRAVSRSCDSPAAHGHFRNGRRHSIVLFGMDISVFCSKWYADRLGS